MCLLFPPAVRASGEPRERWTTETTGVLRTKPPVATRYRRNPIKAHNCQVFRWLFLEADTPGVSNTREGHTAVPISEPFVAPADSTIASYRTNATLTHTRNVSLFGRTTRGSTGCKTATNVHACLQDGGTNQRYTPMGICFEVPTSLRSPSWSPNKHKKKPDLAGRKRSQRRCHAGQKAFKQTPRLRSFYSATTHNANPLISRTPRACRACLVATYIRWCTPSREWRRKGRRSAGLVRTAGCIPRGGS